MKTNHIKLYTAAMISLLLSAEISFAKDRPHLSLFAHSGSLSIQHEKDDPLILTVSIENIAANDTRRSNNQNQNLLDQYAKTEEYADLSDEQKDKLRKDYPVLTIPTFSLGSKQQSVESLIKLTLYDDRGGLVPASFRSLASNPSEPTPIELSGDESHYFRFVLEPPTQESLALGNYSISASIDSGNLTNMWQGEIISYPLQLKLVENSDSTSQDILDRKDGLMGLYLLYDQKFNEAEIAARKWISRNPDSVDAWTQLGESLYGQQKWQQSLEAFKTAQQKFWLKHSGSNPRELPQVILDWIRKLEDR